MAQRSQFCPIFLTWMKGRVCVIDLRQAKKCGNWQKEETWCMSHSAPETMRTKCGVICSVMPVSLYGGILFEKNLALTFMFLSGPSSNLLEQYIGCPTPNDFNLLDFMQPLVMNTKQANTYHNVAL